MIKASIPDLGRTLAVIRARMESGVGQRKLPRRSGLTGADWRDPHHLWPNFTKGS